MLVKTETIAIKVSAEEKALIKKLAEEQNTTISKLLYKAVFKDNVDTVAAMRNELKHYTNGDDLDSASDEQIRETYNNLFKGA